MSHLRIKANESGNKGKDKRLKEQFINSINDNDMMTEIIRELITVLKTSDLTSEHVLAWVRRVKAQRAQKAFIEATKN